MALVISLAENYLDFAEVGRMNRALDEAMGDYFPPWLAQLAADGGRDDLTINPPSFALLARLDGKIAGMAIVICGNVANVDSLYVEGERRGHGIGTALLSAARSEAKKRGYGTMTISALSKNEGARRLYRRFGFDEFRALMYIDT